MLLIAIASLILVSLTPVVGRHLVDAIHRPLLGIDHVGALCLVALRSGATPARRVGPSTRYIDAETKGLQDRMDGS